MTAPLTLHVSRGDVAQLCVDQRQQRVERVGFAPVPGQEQRRRIRTWLRDGSILCRFGSPAPFSCRSRLYGDARLSSGGRLPTPSRRARYKETTRRIFRCALEGGFSMAVALMLAVVAFWLWA